MSFPSLILSETVGSNKRSISGIGVSYGANLTGNGTEQPYMNRLKYEVRRVYTKGNVSYGTATSKTAAPYDKVRLVHTFVGYLDVRSDSVSRYIGVPAQTELNCDLIEQAIVIDSQDADFNVRLFTDAQTGPGNPSQGDGFVRGYSKAPTWTYDVDPSPVTVARWLIKNIDVTDKGNNTSRVTFYLEAVEAEIDLVTILDPYKIT